MDRSLSCPVRHGGFLEVLKIALPLVLSQSCHAANMFTDRLMLAHFSQEAVAAGFTGGLTLFTFSCFFVGLVTYTGTFVAQYEGAGCRNRIGRAVWQGVYLALAGSVVLATGYFWARPFFEMFHHAPAVVVEEARYVKILSLGAPVFLISCVLPVFWTGRGKTVFVLVVSAVGTLCNIPFDYVLIYGKCGFPAGGVAGAATGTILAEALTVAIYFAAFLRSGMRREYGTAEAAPDFGLLKRIFRFGSPNGVHLALDLVSFATFSLMLGCYGAAVHEATGITFGINNLAFCPVIGIAMTASILVGQAVGAGDIPLARKSVRNCLVLATIYNLCMMLLFTVFQDVVLAPFVRADDPGQKEALELSGKMLYFISAYLFFDGINMVLSNALRGAGDTKFTMYAMMGVGIGLGALPCVLFFRLGFPWWSLWLTLIGDILILSGIFACRHHGDTWTKMRVIEHDA